MLKADALLSGERRADVHPDRNRSAERGKSFRARSYYTAENPPFGATFTYYLKEDLKTKRPGVRKPSVRRRAVGRQSPYPVALS